MARGSPALLAVAASLAFGSALAPSALGEEPTPGHRLPGGQESGQGSPPLRPSEQGSPPAQGEGGQKAQVEHGHGRFNRDDPIWFDPDNIDIEKPEEWGVLAYYDVYENHFIGRGDAADRRAVNINTVGEVPDSSWFVNRLGRREMSIEELVQGPNLTGGPAPGTWRVIGRPSGGVTPKFIIEDVNGARFIVKFDPEDNPEISSAAEMVCARFFYGFGYHVAEGYVVDVDLDALEIEPGATFTNHLGERTEITREAIEFWMSNAARKPDGTYRALASKFIEGEHVGEFRFWGTRPDDPNDIFLHEHRRELRGYRVISAWMNHDDSRALNTFDSYIEEDGNRFIRHHMLDFGSCLGSASIGANLPRGGNEYFLEGGPTWKALLTLGLWTRPYLHAEFPDYPAVGNIEGDYFRPDLWKPEYPNAAFNRMDVADAFWAARIVSRFSDEAVRAIVATGEIGDPEAERYLADTIIKRRDKVVVHWISQTNPLDEIEVSGSSSSLRLSWDNAAVRLGVASDAATYAVRWFAYDNRNGAHTDVGDEVEGGATSVQIPAAAFGPADAFGYRYAEAHVSTRHDEFPQWAGPVVITVRERDGEFDIVGIVRPR